MIDANGLGEIVSTYAKYGWQPRRLLLSESARLHLAKSLESLFKESAIYDSDIDAAWFSRPPQTGSIAWELRYLGSSPFALVEHLNENGPDFEQALKAVEHRLKEAVTGRGSA